MDESGLNPAISAIEFCLSHGIKEYVICSGARNSALIAAITSVPDLIVYRHPEERSASYFALGRSIKKHVPVAIVTTSGTAVAELLPSVVEAYYQAVPLVMITADRPVRFRGKGAPQAIEQHNIFGDYAETRIEQWEKDRPLHMNVPLEEPTSKEIENIQCRKQTGMGSPAVKGASDSDTQLLQGFLDESISLTVIVGCLPLAWQEPVKAFLLRLKAPVLAEATSGLREAFPPMGNFDEPQRLLRIGGVPSSRLWRNIEAREDVPVCSVAPNGLPGISRPSLVVRRPDWEVLQARELPDEAGKNIIQIGYLLDKHPLSECSWVRRLSECIPVGSLVFLGNSQPVRQWNIAATHEDRGLRCFACRGANGIDGNVSTFLGLSAEENESWALVGDLTAIYDLAAPWIISQLPDANRRIVVINNGGGRIFHRLPALREFNDDQMQIVENSHTIGFKGWAEMWNMSYRKVSNLADLENLPDGALLVELIPDKEQTDRFWQEFGES
ncbi:MAG: hypothetical protein GY899_08515 [Verrucomicrobiaceae bacterium]|nr:hypothetical protein [Verrucomicrobiaceae bacterium]